MTPPPPGNILLQKIKRSPGAPPPNSLENMAGFETILGDLFDSWPKITQEIGAFFVHWTETECLHGYQYEEVFGNEKMLEFCMCNFCILSQSSTRRLSALAKKLEGSRLNDVEYHIIRYHRVWILCLLPLHPRPVCVSTAVVSDLFLNIGNVRQMTQTGSVLCINLHTSMMSISDRR